MSKHNNPTTPNLTDAQKQRLGELMAKVSADYNGARKELYRFVDSLVGEAKDRDKNAQREFDLDSPN